MNYQLVKTLHIVGALLFLGAGLMTAYYKVRADRSGDLKIITWYQREIVLADWIFTLPSGLLLPLTGWWLMEKRGLTLDDAVWLRYGIILFVAAGVLWLPAVWLQIKMRRLASQALETDSELPPEFHRANKIWMALGVPAFLAAAAVVWLMVSQWSYKFW